MITKKQQKEIDEALYTCITNNQPFVMRLLLEKGANPNAENGRCLITHLVSFLTENVLEDYQEILNLLIQYGVDINKRDENGRTPLMWASERNCTFIIGTLLQHGADIHALDNSRQNAIYYAVKSHDNATLTEILIQHGADVNLKKITRFTALEFAVMNGYFEQVKLLIRHGADVLQGRKPLVERIGQKRRTRHDEEMKAYLQTMIDQAQLNQLAEPAPQEINTL